MWLTAWARFALPTLRFLHDLLQQLEQRLRRGDLRGMAGVDVVVAPAGRCFRTSGELAEGVVRVGAKRVDIAARQGQRPVLQREPLDEAFQWMVDAPLG